LFLGVDEWIVRRRWLPLAEGLAWSALVEAGKQKPESRDVGERALATGFSRRTTHQVVEGAQGLQLARCWKANCAHIKPRKMVIKKAIDAVHCRLQPSAVREDLHSFLKFRVTCVTVSHFDYESHLRGARIGAGALRSVGILASRPYHVALQGDSSWRYSDCLSS
jgi:hypothetical protein